mmetsp:Transcript_17078/g.41991  ORF Transcript_17078/g.41991 Transcript_17078/m.41991 type:complete len:351 (+) Transcript_17078:1159-2211(+)
MCTATSSQPRPNISIPTISLHLTLGRLLGDLVLLDGVQQQLGLLVVGEVVAHGLQNLVQVPGQRRLHIPRVQLQRHEVRLHLLVRRVVLVPPVVRPAAHAELAAPRHDHVLDVLQARVAGDLAGGAVRLLQLQVHVRLGVLHKDGALGVRLGHLLLPLLEPGQHVVAEDHRLVLALDVVAVLARQHVHLALIHAELADVRLEEEDVGALHDGVEDLRRRQVVRLAAAHDLRAAQDARQLVAARDVQHQRPVLVAPLVDLLGGPDELHAAQVHAHRLPHLHHVLAHLLDLLQVAAHLVVHQREPVCDPELEVAARLGELVDVEALHHPLRDVHAARRLEPVVANRHGLLVQ